jgi:hypothetical protein
MRILSLISIVLGFAVLVMGVLFIFQAGNGEQQIVDSITPLTLDEVNPKYDVVAVKYNAVKMAEEPGIQAQTAGPSDTYNYLSAQRALLGLAKANIANVSFYRMSGIVNIAIGLALVLGGLVLYKKSAA